MPRTGAGGNRVDLTGPPPVMPQNSGGQPNGQAPVAQPSTQPIQAPTGLPYGENQQLVQAQQQQPLPASPGGPPPAPAAPGGGGPMDVGAAMQAARQFQMPNLPDFQRPTERPNEPVTAGLPGSPSGPAASGVGNMSSLLSMLAQASNSASISQLAGRAAQAGQ